MIAPPDHTHDPALRSWVASANDGVTDFPIQNLPFGVYRRRGQKMRPRIGVAIGDQVLDVIGAASVVPMPTTEAFEAAAACDAPSLNRLMSLGRTHWRALRHALAELLRVDGRTAVAARAAAGRILVPQSEVELLLPAQVGDYTDFYASVHHATNVGSMFRPDQPLLPNYKWVPIGYHGRASSIGVSPQAFRRPRGQTMPPGASVPQFGPSQKLDIELELGVFIGRGNALGEPIAIDAAESHVFGLCLLNDWSARDIQGWEYQPLGPFLSKNFATTISPWIVTLEALAPFRVPFERPEGDPQPLPYLDSEANRQAGSLDVQLQVLLQTPSMREPAPICSTSYRHAYWTIAQMVAHHTVNGCNLQPGDLFGTGTLSGPTLDQAGALIELTQGGKQPIQLPDGQTRSWLLDGDAVTIRGWCERPGAARIGFGECVGRVLPAIAP